MAPTKKTKFNQFLEDIAMFFSDGNFMSGIHWMEGFVSKVLSLVMVFIIIVSVGDLIIIVFEKIFTRDKTFLDETLFMLFGLFLDILIALEILENYYRLFTQARCSSGVSDCHLSSCGGQKNHYL
jgi:hypothetical protein